MNKNTIDPYSKLRTRDRDNIDISTKIDSSIIKDFFSLVISGDVSKLDIFLNNNMNIINIINYDNGNALHAILNTGLSKIEKLNMVKFLISKKIMINVMNNMGDTPLALATKIFDKEIIIELLNAKANLQTKNSLEVTPLHYLPN